MGKAMIKQIRGQEYADIFAAVYNSANTLFDNGGQYDANGEIFLPQLENDENLVYLTGEDIVGFLSFHRHEQYCELTSLYVRKEFQNQGIGEQLICDFEERIEPGTLTLIKVLKNAPWALNFYQKHRYTFLDDTTADALKALGITEKPWERILRKIQ